MTPKEAVAVAKNYVADLFAADGAKNIGLEELRHEADEGLWLVTIGFSRPWEGPQGLSRYTSYAEGQPWPRTFKTVEIDDASGEVIEVRHWPAAAA